MTSIQRWGAWAIAPRTLITALSLAVALVMLLPLAYLFLRAMGAGNEGVAYLLRERTLGIVWNSITLTVAVTISALIIGVPFAWLTTRTDLPLRRVWLIVGLLPMVIPSYLGAVTYAEAFGAKGMLQSLLEPILGITRLPDIRGFFGAWLSITLFSYPYVVLPVRASLLNTDPSLEEAGRSMGLNRWQIFWRVTLPQLRPALGIGVIMTALYTLSDFGAVAVMRYNAFTRAIYQQYTSTFNSERAALLALVLVMLTLLLLYSEQRMTRAHANYRIGTGTRRQLRPVKLGMWRVPSLLFSTVLVGIGVLVPLGVLLSWLLTRQYNDPVPVAMSELVSNTIAISFLAGMVASVLALPMGVLASKSTTPLTQWLIRLTYVGNVLPGIVIALALVFFTANYLPMWYQTFPILITGYVMRYLPFSIGTTRSALTQINPRIEESARSLGANSWGVLWRVTIPLARSGILAGMALVFLNVMKELPTTLILSPIGFRTLASRIWSVQNEGMLVLIGQPGILLMLTSAVGLAVILWRDSRLKG